MREFSIQPFGSLSAASIEAHLGLYKGYAEQTAAVLEQLGGTPVPGVPATLTPREALARRLSFEGNGTILHELFFEQFETPSSEDAGFSAVLAPRFGSFAQWQQDILELGKTRGPGWILTCRGGSGLIDNYWIDLHELGTPAGSTVLYVVDLWEHAYWSDYGAKGREKFMRDLFDHSDWELVGRRCQQAQRRTR